MKQIALISAAHNKSNDVSTFHRIEQQEEWEAPEKQYLRNYFSIQALWIVIAFSMRTESIISLWKKGERTWFDFQWNKFLRKRREKMLNKVIVEGRKFSKKTKKNLMKMKNFNAHGIIPRSLSLFKIVTSRIKHYTFVSLNQHITCSYFVCWTVSANKHLFYIKKNLREPMLNLLTFRYSFSIILAPLTIFSTPLLCTIAQHWV